MTRASSDGLLLVRHARGRRRIASESDYHKSGPLPLRESTARIGIKVIANALAYAHAGAKWCTATSSRRTSCFRAARRSSWTSGWRARSVPAAPSADRTAMGLPRPWHAGLHEPGTGDRAAADSTAAPTSTPSAACVYEMVTGQPPLHRAHRAGDPGSALRRTPVPSLRAARPDVPLALEQAITRALQKSPADRFATAGEFVEAIDLAAARVRNAEARRKTSSQVGRRQPSRCHWQWRWR